MRVVFFQPYYFNIWESVGVGYMAAYARAYGEDPDLEVSFLNGYFDDDEVVLAEAAGADIFAVSCTSPTYAHGLRLAERVKEENPRVRTVFGGWHPSALPELVIREEAVDQVVVGEGEEPMLRIVRGDRSPILGRIAPVHPLAWPDRGVVRNEREVDLCEQMVGRRIASFQSVRVCPMRCAFCAERTVTGAFHRKSNPLRVREVGDLVAEINSVASTYRLDHFKFVDATWNTSEDKVLEFCDEYRRRGAGISWEANVHAAFATPEMLVEMAGAGCRQVNVGCESGSDRILRMMRKGVTTEQLVRVFEWARRAGLERRAFFLIGMPEESEEDLLLTEDLIRRLDPEVVGVTILCPYPGTELYDPQKHEGVDWSETDEYSNSFWRTRHMDNSDLHRWQQRLLSVLPGRAAWHHEQIRGDVEERLKKGDVS